MATSSKLTAGFENNRQTLNKSIHFIEPRLHNFSHFVSKKKRAKFERKNKFLNDFLQTERNKPLYIQKFHIDR